MNVSKFIVNYLASLNIKHVFLITGGAIAFFVDELSGRNDINYICMHHEQSAAMAAESYSRVGPGLGVATATSGPGATNLITGICCAWFDSIPCLYITGQVNTEEQKGESKVRQIGFQETDIVEIVKPITKFAQKLERAEDIRYVLEKAVYLAKSGRSGPVLVDVPVNLQYAEINPKKLKGFNLPNVKKNVGLAAKVIKTIDLLNHSKRPVLLIGFGIHLSGAQREKDELLKILNIPVITTWSGLDLVPFNNPNRVGQSGIYGDRASNLTIQNADLLISVGARLDTRQTGGKPQNYAREANKVVIDIDKAELDKKRGLNPDLPIRADAKEFLSAFLKQQSKIHVANITDWTSQIKSWKKKYPILKEAYFKQKEYVNPYIFCKVLSDLMSDDAIIILDTGASLAWTIQGIQLREGQRLFSAFGNSPMGYALPAAIGACFAIANTRPVICITGDGGLQINIQEFQTIIHHKLPVKIFNLNNKCYGIIKQFQDTWINSRYEASQKGYSTPDFIKVAKSYGLNSVQIKNNQELKRKITQVLSSKGPVFCDVLLNPDQKVEPKIEFGMPLEDMTPYLPRAEFRKNMLISPLPESLKLKI